MKRKKIRMIMLYRLLARIIDFSIILLVSILSYFLALLQTSIEDGFLTLPLHIGLVYLIFILSEVFVLKGKTLGMSIFQIYGWSQDGHQISISKAIIKELYIFLFFVHMLIYPMGIFIFLIHFLPLAKPTDEHGPIFLIDYIFKYRYVKKGNPIDI